MNSVKTSSKTQKIKRSQSELKNTITEIIYMRESITDLIMQKNKPLIRKTR